MKYVYTLRYWVDGSRDLKYYNFASGASFELALRSASTKVHRQHPSKQIDIRSFTRYPIEKVSDSSENNHEQ